MPSTFSFTGVLLLAAGSGSLTMLGGCSGQIKVQRVMYQTPAETCLIIQDEVEGEVADQERAKLAPELGFAQVESLSLVGVDEWVEPYLAHLSIPLETIEQVQEVLEGIYDLDNELVQSSMREDPNRMHSLAMIAEIDRLHAEKLKEIIEGFGWPTREMVGIKGVQGAYIAIQHAGDEPEFQQNCLALIQQQVDQGELPGAFLALMTDRVCLLRGESQVYGTQMTMAPDEFGVMKAVPAAMIRYPESLDQRREALGMPTHGRFAEAIEVAYFEAVAQAGSQITSVQTE